jgi:hypothetical protein
MYKPKRVLLNIYVKESIRLERIEYALKVRGISRTDWINRAIREKLDRDHPETNAMSADYVPAKIPLDSPQAMEALQRLRKERETLDKALEAFEVPAVKDAPALVMPPPPAAPAVPAVPAAPAAPAAPAVPAVPAVPAAANGDDADFWGEDEMDMDRAAAMLRRIRQR